MAEEDAAAESYKPVEQQWLKPVLSQIDDHRRAQREAFQTSGWIGTHQRKATEFPAGQAFAPCDEPHACHRRRRRYDLSIDTQLAKHLHRPCVDDMRLGLPVKAGPPFEDGCSDATPLEERRQCQPDRPGTDNCNLNTLIRHHHSND
jgi:hypothetical protein